MKSLVLLPGLFICPAASLTTVPLHLQSRRISTRQMSTVDGTETDSLNGQEVPYYLIDAGGDKSSPSTVEADICDAVQSLGPLDEGTDLQKHTSKLSQNDDSSNIASTFLQTIIKKIGHIDESRLVSSDEYRSGIQPKLFSNLEYRTIIDASSNTTSIIARPSQSSILASSSLLCGTGLASGILFLPSAVLNVGYMSAIPASLVAYGYMTVSSLLTAELLLNRCGETGRVRNVGLLELYNEYLGEKMGRLAGFGFVTVCYVMMGIYFSEGSDKLSSVISSVTNTDTTNISQYTFVSTTIFASTIAIFLATASKFGAVQTIMTKVLVPLTLLASITVIIYAFPTADFESLLSSANQHPEVVLNAFPMLFMSWSSHAVVPRVVYDLEGDENKIKQAIWGGSTAALIIYLVWNAVVLGNVNIDSATNINNNLNTQLMTPTAIVSIFAVVTSLIGTILGFVNEFYDAIGTIPSQSFGPTDDNKWQVAMLTLTPPALCSIMLGYYHQLDHNSLNLDRYHIMEYTGAFGASTLFLILPALMVWQNRYGDDARPLTVKPMFPLGKITLGSLYKAAGTLIVEQGLEKLGVFEFVSNHFLLKSTPL